MRHLFAAFGIALALDTSAISQCSILAVSGSLDPGETIVVAVSGATPNALTFLLTGSNPGTTTISLGPLGSLTVGLDQPFSVLPIGVTDANGNVSFSTTIAPNAPSFPAATFTLQAVTFEIVPMPPLSFCVSNTAVLTAGAGSTLKALRRWTRVMLDANALDHTPGSGPPHTPNQQIGPCRTARAMAIVEIAMFETLIAIDGGYQSHVGLAPVHGNVSRPAAIAQAGRDTLVALYPSQAAILDAALATDLTSIPGNGRAKTAGIALGHAAASAILAMRAADGSNHAEPLVNIDFVCSLQPGFWRQDPIVLHPLALGAFWSQVAPFVMTSADQFQAPAPPAMTSAEYTAAYDEVKSLGGEGVITPTARTADQTWAGIFWGYDGMPGLGTPQRLYNHIILEIADQEGSSAIETARLLALANTAMADAGLAIWESKYRFQFWRPCSGIRQSDPGTGPTGLGDGNPATVGDTNFAPLGAPVHATAGVDFFTPPFPAYPSGHAGFGGALFQVLRRFYGTDSLPFTFISDELNGVTTDNAGNPRPLLPRAFHTLSQAEEENGQSRIYLGIHWTFDKTAGIAQGNSVGNWVFDHIYQPVP